MRLLLDTHIFLWWTSGARQLSPKARRAIENGNNECWFSIASAWEMAIKSSLGKLVIEQSLERFIAEQLSANGFRLLGIDLRHTAAVMSLPWHHRDPFDRLLVVQAQIEGLTLVTSDKSLTAYGGALLV